MTRKDYDLIAHTLRGAYPLARPGAGAQAVLGAARELAHAFASENPRFDKAKFLIACGYDPDSRLVRMNA